MIPTVERIVLPWFESDGIGERDLRSLNYASTRAIPTLKSLEDAFKDSLEQRVEEDARREVGYLGGLIEAAFEREYAFGNHLFSARVARETSGPTAKTVLGKLTPYVERCRDDPLSRLGRNVIVHSDERYVDPKALIDRHHRIEADVETDTKTSIAHGWASHERFALDEYIETLEVVPVPEAHRRLNAANAQTHYLIKSLKKRIEGFVKESKERIKSEYGVSTDASQVAYVPLSDGSIFRLLPLEKQSVSYAGILNGVLGPRTTKSAITKTTGDLVIAAELGFEADYERKGASGVRITSEANDDKTRTLVIARPDSLRSYRMVRENEIVFVRVEDLVVAMSDLTRAHTKKADNTKHEFLSPIPEYLANA